MMMGGGEGCYCGRKHLRDPQAACLDAARQVARQAGCGLAWNGSSVGCLVCLGQKKVKRTQGVHRKDWTHNPNRDSCMRVCLLL